MKSNSDNENSDAKKNIVQVDQADEVYLNAQQINTTSLTDNDELDLLDVIIAINEASKTEINELNLGFNDLKKSILKASKTNLLAPQDTTNNKSISSVNAGGLDRYQTNSTSIINQSNKNQVNQVTKTENKAVKPTIQAINTNNSGNAITKNESALHNVSEGLDDSSERDISRTARARRKSVIAQSVDDVIPKNNNAIPKSNIKDPILPTQSIEKKKPKNKVSGISNLSDDEFDGFYRDNKGRLHQKNGKFASKAQIKKYGKKGDQDDSQEEKSPNDKNSQSLLSKLVNAVTGQANKADGVQDNVGAGIGGSYYLAAKELASLAGDSKEFIDAQKEKLQQRKQDKKDKADAALLEKDSATDNKKDSPINATDTKKGAPINTDVNNQIIDELTNTTKPKSKAKPTKPTNKEKSASNKAAKNSVKQVKTQSEQLKTAKISNQKNEQHHAENIIALKEIKEAISDIPIDNQGSSLLPDFGLPDKKKRRKTTKTKRGNALSNNTDSDQVSKKNRRANMRGGAYGSDGGGIPSVSQSTGSVAKAGGKFSGALKMGGAALSKLALPLTVAMGAYDAVSGWNNEDQHQETFNLKEGEKATTGQKAASALGSVLSLGGLTELIGISGGDIAKTIYSPFADKDKSDISQDKKTDPVISDISQDKKTDPVISDISQDKKTDPVISDISQDKKTDPAISDISQALMMSTPIVASVGAMATKQISGTQDIEQIEAINNLNSNKQSTQSVTNNSSISDSKTPLTKDADILKVLQSIDKKLSKNSDSKIITMPNHSQKIPYDFDDVSLKIEANNLG